MDGPRLPSAHRQRRLAPPAPVRATSSLRCSAHARTPSAQSPKPEHLRKLRTSSQLLPGRFDCALLRAFIDGPLVGGAAVLLTFWPRCRSHEIKLAVECRI